MADSDRYKTDIELMSASKSGDTQAFSILVERYFSMVYTIAYGRLKNRETAEDLAQEVFLRIYLYLNEGRQPYYFAGWIVRITHNLITDWNRSGQHKSKLLPMVSMEEIEKELPDEKGKDVRDEMDVKRKTDVINEAIFKLPVEQREIVLLHYMEGLNQKEIAERLGVHPSTIGRQLSRAHDALKDLLGPLLQETVQSLRPPKKAVLQTIAIIGAASVLSINAKASVLEAAGGKVWVSSVAKLTAVKITTIGKIFGLLQNITALIASGGKIMGAGKTIAAVIIATAVVVGGYHYSNKSDEKINPIIKPLVESQAKSQPLTMPATEFVLDGVQIKPSKAKNMSTSQMNRKFIGEGMDFLNLILNAYDTSKVRLIFNFAIPDKNTKYDITSKLLLGQNEDLNVITQKGIESYFGLKVSREERYMDVYVLKVVPEFASRLNAHSVNNLNNQTGQMMNVKTNFKNGKIEIDPAYKEQMKKELEKKISSSLPNSNNGKVRVNFGNGNNPQEFDAKKNTLSYNTPQSIMTLGGNMNLFAKNLEGKIDVPVINETNLGDNKYNIEIECNLNNIEEIKKVLFDQYGLELKSDKRKIEMLIFDKKQ